MFHLKNVFKQEVAEGADGGAPEAPKVDEKKMVIQSAFEAAVTTTEDEDQVKMAMIASGATFKNVTRLFNEFMVSTGRVASKEDKDKAVTEVLSGQDLSTEENFTALTGLLQEQIPGFSDKQAASLIRAFAKKNDVEAYKKPKTKTGAGANGFAHRFYAFLTEFPTCSQDEAKGFIRSDDKTSGNVVKHEGHYLKIADLVNKVAANAAA